MEKTKTISIRLDRLSYEKIILECEKRNINKTEWLERKIAIANNAKVLKEDLLDLLVQIEAMNEAEGKLKSASIIGLRKTVNNL